MSKCLIITGASRGIGKATAKHFQENDWTVINLSRHACDVAGVCNIEVDFLKTGFEVSIAAELRRIVASTKTICLTHNAAGFIKDDALAIDAQQLRQLLEINIIAPTQLNKMIRPYMNKGSSIIYVGSTLAEMAVPNTASYSISKHALAGLMKATCQDLATDKIHTCCVCPGFTNTDMLNQHIHHDAAIKKALADRVYAKRLIEPEEIADLIYYCAEHPVINGAMLHAHLGQTNT